ncbi:hypothetical protein GYMLUDRAFT_179651 [Collybiopsis luxurians FD-317 M1]|uniref:DUF155 domain-containing protein n=1 Tax=Collybiopsis luxurians FD-317 M1 TaxID=944289 RepID=A0A0D0BE04_9AGAR|nr:hypothetical protein GYMLUDRAFT_179651 [Collybiopsis luxurians FD-317 M1]
MSRTEPQYVRLPTSSQLPSPTTSRKLKNRIPSLNVPRTPDPHSARPPRRASISGLTTPLPGKSQRTSKTSQKLVVLPSAPQTKPIGEDDDVLGYETDAGVRVRDHKSQAERMSKEQRERAGMKRITAYCIAESFKMKLLSSFLKREHNVTPRVFDEALYVMYHLPLLPGYGHNANVRSSAPLQTGDGKSIHTRLSEAEEMGYQGSYFTYQPNSSNDDGYMTSNSPVDERRPLVDRTPTSVISDLSDDPHSALFSASSSPETENAEVVFFDYGVAVFFGLTESQEKSILEDIENAGILRRRISENRWEIEECHFAHDPNIAYPRVYNDFFTLKSRSHLLKLSIAHALAQSTLLAHFETTAQQVLSSPQTLSIPRQLADKGALQLKRREALKLTGKLFTLRRDVNLVSNVLDVPELFWDEASLKELYDAVREYMEISGRVQVLNEKLGMASDFLEAIHDHLNNSAMERITWIVIWLIVVAILVELGEVIARLIVHATTVGREGFVSSFLAGRNVNVNVNVSREEVIRTLDRMAGFS